MVMNVASIQTRVSYKNLDFFAILDTEEIC